MRPRLAAMQPLVADRPEAWWSAFLGVSAEALRAPGCTVVAHAGLGDWRGVWFFSRGDSLVVSAPDSHRRALERSTAGWCPGDVPITPECVEAWVGPDVALVIGPSYQGWLPPERFRPIDDPRAVELGPGRRAALERFRAACPREDWDLCGIDPDLGPIQAVFEGDDAVALGQLRMRAADVVDPSILTLPEARGRGHAAHIVSALAHGALARGQLVLYQTLHANLPAVGVAERLGFEAYASLIAVRLRPG